MSWGSTFVFRGGYPCCLTLPCIPVLTCACRLPVVVISLKDHNLFSPLVCFLRSEGETHVLLASRLMFFASLSPLALPLVCWQVARIALRSGCACSLWAR